MNKNLEEVFEDNGAFLGVYFILDESRSEPPLHRGHLMLNAGALLDRGSPAANALYALACDLIDCEQEAQRIIGGLRARNPDLIGTGSAYDYLLRRLEDCPLATKFTITGEAINMGLQPFTSENGQSEWARAYQHYQRFEHQFDLFMFRLRTRHWERSNADALVEMRAADAAADAAGATPAAVA